MNAPKLVAPRDIAEAAAAVHDAAAAQQVVLVTGHGSKRSWTRVPERVDVELSTRALTGIVAYEPGDGVITALAGTPWSDLERAVAAHGHHLSPWISDAENASVGGVVAAGQSGSDRLRFSPLRHHVLGLRTIDGEGRIVKSGGRLVKNVSGFDLHRLHTGAYGSLGLIVEVSLRLHAAPESHAIGLGYAPTRDAALATARGVLARCRSAWTVLVHDVFSEDHREPSRRFGVVVLAAGLTEALEADLSELRVSVPELRWDVAEHGAASDSRVLSTWGSMGHFASLTPTLCVSCAPSRLDAALSAFDAAARESRVEARIRVQPGLGCFDAWIHQGLDASTVTRIMSNVQRANASVHWRGLDDALRSQVDLFGPTDPAGLALMRRLKSALDPLGTFPSGRLVGGL